MLFHSIIWHRVMFGKNHLTLITVNIIQWYWKKQVGGGWLDQTLSHHSHQYYLLKLPIEIDALLQLRNYHKFP